MVTRSGALDLQVGPRIDIVRGWGKDRTGWTIKQVVRTARRHRTVHIRVGQHLLTAEDPCRPNCAARVRSRFPRVVVAWFVGCAAGR
jgi:hypothetical protein